MAICSREESQKEGKKFVIRFISVSLCLLGLLIAFNWSVNPYCIFRHRWITAYDINPRYTKLQRLTEDPEHYTGLIMGTCLSSVMRPELADKLSGYRYYNLSTHNSKVIEPYVFLEYLLKKGVRIKQIIFNMDGFSTDVRWETLDRRETMILSQAYLSGRWPQALIGGSFFEHFAPFLISVPVTKRSLLSLYYDWHKLPPPTIEMPNGYWKWQAGTLALQDHPREHVIKVLETAFPSIQSDQDKWKFSGFSPPSTKPLGMVELDRFNRLAVKHGIDVIYFFPPAFALSKILRWEGERGVWKVKEWLDIIGEFYDFKLYNSITLDPYNYLTNENFTPEVGDKLLEEIYNYSDRDFGFLVTYENVDAYLLLKEKQERIFQEQFKPFLRSIPFQKWQYLDFKELAERYFNNVRNNLDNALQ